MPSSAVAKPAFPIALRNYNTQHHRERCIITYIQLETLLLSNPWALAQVPLGSGRARLQLAIPEAVQQQTVLPNIEVRRAISRLRLGLMTQQHIGEQNCICIDMDMQSAAIARRRIIELLRRMGYPVNV